MALESKTKDSKVGNRFYRPLLSVAMHPSEDLSEYDPYLERLRLFKELSVTQHFGLEWNEFLRLPRHRVMSIFKLCDQYNSKADSSAKTILDELNGSVKK